MVRKQVKALTVLYLFPCQHFGVYFAPYQILLVMGAVFVLLAIPFLLFYDRTVLQRMPAAAGMRLYANGYRPVMDALLPLLFYCVLPCVVLKSFCIEYSAKGAVELAVSITAGAGVLLLSRAVSWLFFRKAPWRQIGTVLIIVNAAPIGSNIAVYAQRLGLDSSYAVQMVCLSTLLSLITLPVMLGLAAALGFA